MNPRISPPLESEDEVVKRTCAKAGELVGMVDDSHGELNKSVVKLAQVFYDGVSEMENWAGDVDAKAKRNHGPSDQQKRNQNSKT